MSNDQAALRDETFKQEGMDVAHRVYYTLSHKREEQARRNSKALALLFKLIAEKGLMTPEELDDLLLNVSRWNL
jgi:hypothetical protein